MELSSWTVKFLISSIDISEPDDSALASRISANFAAEILTDIEPDRSSKNCGESKLIVGLVAKFDPSGNESPLTYKLFDETKVVLKSTKFCSEIEVYTSLPLLVRIIEEERLSNPGSL